MDSNHTCLAVISLDSALKKDENYYPQVFLKECKYVEKKVVRHIYDNLSYSSSSNESDGSDEEKIKTLRINAEFWLANENIIYNEVSKQNSLGIN